MRLSVLWFLGTAAALILWAQSPIPRVTSADPASGKSGDIIVINGENLQKAQVDKVFLTDGKHDTPVEVMEQTATTIKFKIPAKLAAGRLSVMILTAGKMPEYLEEPVRVEIVQ